MDYKTPGVYIEEISTLPASIAAVATAVPAFVGYTEKRNRNGEEIPLNKPVRITSFLEYIEYFGRAYPERFGITLTGSDTTFDNTTVTVNVLNSNGLSPYRMYYQVQQYFTNGGGPCYIVPVGNYLFENPGNTDISHTALVAGLNALEEEDEPTLLVVPEAVRVTATNRKTIHDAMLAQCRKLQDRFAIMDVEAIPTNSILEDATAFRAQVGSSNLNYGAAYYPNFISTIIRYYLPAAVPVDDDRTGSDSGPFHDYTLDAIGADEEFAIGRIIITDNANIDGDAFTVGGSTLTEGSEFTKGTNGNETAAALMEAINGLNSTDYTVERAGNVILLKATEEGSPGEGIVLTYTDSGSGDAATVTGGGTLKLVPADKTLYNAIKKQLERDRVNLYPCGSIAGVYARVDGQRGVWKAPANVDVRGILRPGKAVSSEEQASLNVDATSGKSINVVRTFSGKGPLVWGARTLAGNDNEWRYVPVRRFFIFVEESVKKATEFVVFEPNSAPTWQRVKTMIENFLAKQWREGALAGAKAEDAFFVRVGLGQTMTSIDILEGRMNIEIGMAAVRPAEFIILKFSHKLQES